MEINNSTFDRMQELNELEADEVNRKSTLPEKEDWFAKMELKRLEALDWERKTFGKKFTVNLNR